MAGKIFTLCCLLVAGACGVGAEDWPQWRGPDRNGISSETGLLMKWPDEGPPILWKGKVGMGFSSMVIGDGRLYTMGHADETDTVFCFHALSGKVLWKHSYPAEFGDKYYQGGTTGTPTIDGDRVFTLSRWGDLFCFEAATGKIVWNRNVHDDAGIRLPDWGFTGAPTVHGDLLILNVRESGMAVNKRTGKTVWESPDKKAGYSTPLPVEREGDDWMIIGSEHGYISVNPETGKEQWRMRWLTQYGVNAADPIVRDDLVFISSGYGKGAALFRPKAGGEPEVIWTSKVLRTQLNPAVLVGEYLYGVDGDTTQTASLKCIEFATGKEMWSEAGFGSGGLVVADGNLIALSAKGELMVAPATSKEFAPVSRAQVLGGKSWTAPVLANGIVYCRNSRGDLVAVDLRARK